MQQIQLSNPAAGSETVLSASLKACRAQLWSVAAFSGLANILQLTVSLYMMQVFDRVMATRSMDTLFWLTLIAVACIGILAALEGARGQVMQRVAGWVEERVAPETFTRAVEAQLRGRPYRMEAMRDLATCRSWFSSPSALALYDVPWVPVYLGVIFLLHPMLGALALAGAAILFAMTLINEWLTAPLLKNANSSAMATHRRAESIARNAEVIDSMGMLPAVLRRWRSAVSAAAPDSNRAADRAATLLAVTKFVRLAVQIGVLGVGAYLVVNQQLTAGASIAASIIMGRALAPVEQMIGAWKQLVQARQSYTRLKMHLAVPRIRPEGAPLPAPEGRLSVERVTYALPGQPSPIIKGITFGLAAGETLAIIGPSAAGKTTLVRMLIGTLAPSTGTVRLDSADVYTWLREDFGRYVGYLPQDVELFEGSVRDNISRMQEANTEAVYEAAKLAGCHEMILRLPQGYDTEIGEGGQHLSGGQRQMIGLARALFGSPRLVVLDEPNSNLDGDSEANLIQSIQALRQKRTTVVLVSHRPTLVQAAEKILLMRDGAIDMFGPKAEVLKRLMNPVPRAPQAPGQPSQPGPASPQGL